MRTLTSVSLLAITLALASSQAAERVVLIGKILDAAGAPVENATVLVYKAGVRIGYSTYCPTCYVDCGKHVVTAQDGAFEIRGLSPGLLFTLLVLHDGDAAAQVDRVDPEKGPLAPVSLKPRTPVNDPARVVRGRVTDLQGHVLRNAVVEQQGVIFPTGGQSYGPVNWVDLIAVTNENGDFEIAHTKPAAKFILSVAARGMAPKLFTEATGLDRKTMPVAEGATVHGRLLYKGKPVTNAELGLMSHNRRSGTSYPETRIGTQEDGTFIIANVPAGRIWTLYPKMESVAARNWAALPLDLETKDNGEDVNVGDIELAPAHTLTGQVLLTDAKPVPEGMRVTLSSDRAWDSQIALLPPDGRFEFAGLAPGVYSISPALKGYELPEGFEQEVMVTADRQITIRVQPRAR